MSTEILVVVIASIGVIATIAMPIIFRNKKKFKKNKDNGFYYFEDDTVIPYCPKCYESKRRKTKLPENRICQKCKSNYQRNPVIHVVKLKSHTSKFRFSN